MAPTTAIKGTNGFMAPELLGYLDGISAKSVADFMAADMWALGEIIFQMLTGENTFPGPLDLMKYCTGQREFPCNRLPPSVTDDSREVLTGIMAASPQHRMTTTQCIKHNWMQSVHIEESLSSLDIEEDSMLLESQYSWDEPASARWSTSFNSEDVSAQSITKKGNQRDPYTQTALPQDKDLSSDCLGVQQSPHDIQQTLHWIERTLEQDPPGTERKPCQLAFSPDSKRLLCASEEKATRIWNVDSGEIGTIMGLDKVISVAFSPDGKLMAFGSDVHVELRDGQTGNLVKNLGFWYRESDYVAFSPDNKWLFSREKLTGTTRFWDVRTRTEVVEFKLEGFETKVAFSPDSHPLAITRKNGAMYFWDYRSRNKLRTLYQDWRPIDFFIFSPNGLFMAVASSQKLVSIWNTTSPDLVRTLHTNSWFITGISFTSDSARLIVSGGSSVGMWDVRTWELVQTLEMGSDYIALSPDGRWLALYDGEVGVIKLLHETQTLWKVVQTTESLGQWWGHMTFSPDSKWLAAGSDRGVVKVWKLE